MGDRGLWVGFVFDLSRSSGPVIRTKYNSTMWFAYYSFVTTYISTSTTNVTSVSISAILRIIYSNIQ
jgi:hypothetical protein